MMTSAQMRCSHILLVLLLRTAATAAASGLSPNFYYGRCSYNPEKIITSVVQEYLQKDKTLAAGLLRLAFHDAFVRGCDASVLLLSSDKDAERDAVPNLSLRGFEAIDAAKAAVEKICPGLVSCADIIQLAARDSVYFIGGPWWAVPLGRRDGFESHASETSDLPSPFFNITQLKAAFAKKGLDTVDLVALSGAHTIGRSHCASIIPRLYDSNGNEIVDPALDKYYAAELRKYCPFSNGNSDTTVEMDKGSSLYFDNNYYAGVTNKKGLFTSDAQLLAEGESAQYVWYGVYDSQSFYEQFADSMIKMSEIGVLTGSLGEIRYKCAYINS